MTTSSDGAGRAGSSPPDVLARLDPRLADLARPVRAPTGGPVGPILFTSSNGGGMGHLMRLLAVALRLPVGQASQFFSLSGAADVLARSPFPWAYMSTYSATFRGVPWNRQLRARLESLVDRVGATTLVFDGVAPYDGVAQVAAMPGVRSVWMRRGLWQAGVGDQHLRHLDAFDLVVEPGEMHGAITVPRGSPHLVGPITLVDRSHLLDRATAREVLGLPPDRRVALVTLGAGRVAGRESVVERIVDRLRDSDWLVAIPGNPLSAGAAPSNVVTFRSLPMAHLFPAFDAAVAASGYNSTYELMVAGVPTMFVPNPAARTDDQALRARMAEQAGFGLVGPMEAQGAVTALGELLDDGRRADLADALGAASWPNGAAQVAELLTGGPA